MSQIKILPEHISNRIAAGEVIERPASIVKELVENAIDAGATQITITVINAGQKLISISDNGSGMDSDDAFLCLEQHATSKISVAEDIDSICSFGFRGEAIPSIASVSRFTIRTRKEDAIDGTEVFVQAGKILSTKPIGCAVGTEMQVKDLFFNTPARKKYLKTAPTEEKHIQETLYLIAIPHTEVSFELIMDGRRVFQSPAHNDLKMRLSTFFGRNYVDGLIPIAYKNEGVSVKGFVSKHGITRTNRKEQRAFVNGRAIDSPAIYKGIRNGFGGLIEKGRFPLAIIFIRVEPNTIDVNVHPAKREIRFKNELIISSTIAECITMSLKQNSAPTASLHTGISLKNMLNSSNVGYRLKQKENNTPDLELDYNNQQLHTSQPQELHTSQPQELHTSQPQELHTSQPQELHTSQPQELHTSQPQELHTSQPNEKIHTSLLSDDIKPVSEKPPVVDENKTLFPGGTELEILGQIDNTYIVAKSPNGLIVIDQHAAHERVLYEKILNNQKKSEAVQPLLFPITLDFQPAEIRFLLKNNDTFYSVGFGLEPFGENTILLTSIPSSIKQENAGGLIKEMLDSLLHSGEIKKNVDINTIAQVACKAAIKAHDELKPSELEGLLKQMAQCELPFSCPHGRPTIINIGLKELEKRFGRT